MSQNTNSDISSQTTSRRRLGRGLDALIVNTSLQFDDISPSDEEQSENASTAVQTIAVSDIQPNPHQPRTQFAEDALNELAESIRQHGIIQPLIVTQNPEKAGQYWLVAGERRWRAAQLADLVELPAIVREASPQELLELALIENIQRADLNSVEEALAYQSLISEFGLTQAEVAERVSKSRSAVTNTLRLLKLPIVVQEALMNQRISAGHARALLALPNEEILIHIFGTILEQGLSVRQTESMVKALLTKDEATPDEPITEDDEQPEEDAEDDTVEAIMSQMENRFRSRLGTRVNLNRNADGSGRLVVHFYNDDDLQNLYQIITHDEDG
ncbi:MAG: ParB/RepB/Spo0J family partition protein [Chloroflexota bacterium]